MKKLVVTFIFLFGLQNLFAATCSITYASCNVGYLASCADGIIRKTNCGLGKLIPDCILDDGYYTLDEVTYDYCPAGYYCLDPNQIIPCDEGYYCPRGSTTSHGKPLMASSTCAKGAECPCDNAYYCPSSSKTSHGETDLPSTDCGTNNQCPCPTGFTATTPPKGRLNQCMAGCVAGQRVETANSSGCVTSTGDWYSSPHNVYYGSASILSTDWYNCRSGFHVTPSTTITDHDNVTDCKISCSKGTYIPDSTTSTACAVCPTGTYKPTDTVVSQSTQETCTSCPSGTGYNYNANSSSQADQHDAQSDCQLACAAGSYVTVANQGCATPSNTNGPWYVGANIINYGSTTPINPTPVAITPPAENAPTVNKCIQYYATPNTTVITDHDSYKDCSITCAAGKYTPTLTADCTDVNYGYFKVGSSTVTQSNATAGTIIPRTDCESLDGENPPPGTTPSHGLPVNTATGGYNTAGLTSNIATACLYYAPDKTIKGCQSVTVNSVQYNGTKYPDTPYNVVAKPGYLISDNGSPYATCVGCPAGHYISDGNATTCLGNYCTPGYYCPETSTSGHGQPQEEFPTCPALAECLCGIGYYCPKGSQDEMGRPLSSPEQAATGCDVNADCRCPSQSTTSRIILNINKTNCFVDSTQTVFVDSNNSGSTSTGFTLQSLLGVVDSTTDQFQDNKCFYNP